MRFEVKLVRRSSYFAPLHFIKPESNLQGRLIAQSLICLRSCFEAAGVMDSGLLSPDAHELCEPSCCKIECIVNITSHLELYIEELSRVLFKKREHAHQKLVAVHIL